MKQQNVLITGAGLAGSLLAIYLAKKGFRVDVYERRPDMRKENIDGGRSINLALSTRGIYALQEVDLADTVLKNAIPMRGRMIHSIENELTFQPYGVQENEVINSTSRAGLNSILMDAAEGFETVSIHFNQRCLGMDFQSGEVSFLNEKTGETITKTADTVIACDGATSAIRLEMQKVGRFNLNQMYLEHGYKELTIPPGPNGAFQMEKEALHIWPRGTYMLIALPNLDGSFTCTLFFPFEGEYSFASLNRSEKMVDFFQQQFPDAVPLIADLEGDFFGNLTGNLITIKCAPWYVGGKALLLGDSAHAIVPFYGQGMNCAFEDCTLLNQIIDQHGDDWETVFSEYQLKRKADADAIAQLALDNFIEMRDSVANPKFLLKKKLERQLEEQFPGEFLSTYSRVTFHRLPYSEALEMGKIQDRILMEICNSTGKIEELDLKQVLAKVAEKVHG